ncbi:MAG TPA: hypothetical protein VJG32_14675 [Anaerolineae bacterium]|nr:hypothetical protein [Anaerolineae bacterium]
MDIWVWLLVAVLVLVPKRTSARDAGFDRVRSLALLLGLLYLITQTTG